MKLNVCFFIKGDEKYNETWEKVSNIIKKLFDREPVYKKMFLKLN